jgi:signal transduction histidine kinase
MCIVKEIIELHGGHIELASKVGAGTTVTIWLQASSATSETHVASNPARGEHA